MIKFWVGELYVWRPNTELAMRHDSKSVGYKYTSHGEVRICELCGNRRLCNENDGLVACQTCQLELLPSKWALG